MKITKKYLRVLIKEEIAKTNLLNEAAKKMTGQFELILVSPAFMNAPNSVVAHLKINGKIIGSTMQSDEIRTDSPEEAIRLAISTITPMSLTAKLKLDAPGGPSELEKLDAEQAGPEKKLHPKYDEETFH